MLTVGKWEAQDKRKKSEGAEEMAVGKVTGTW